MAIIANTLRPGFLVSLKTIVKGNVSWDRDRGSKDVRGDGAEVEEWKTKRTILDRAEHEASQKARTKAGNTIRGICKQTAFGLLCPEDEADKLEQAISDARQIISDFNAGSTYTSIGIYVLAGRIVPDDVEAVRAINSEISDLMKEMSAGVENGDAEAIRKAASSVKSIGEMLTVDARAKVQMAVDEGRAVATRIKKDEKDGQATLVDKTAVRRLNELRTAFLDLDDSEPVAQEPAKKRRGTKLDLGA